MPFNRYDSDIKAARQRLLAHEAADKSAVYLKILQFADVKCVNDRYCCRHAVESGFPNIEMTPADASRRMFVSIGCLRQGLWLRILIKREQTIHTCRSISSTVLLKCAQMERADKEDVDAKGLQCVGLACAGVAMRSKCAREAFEV